MTDDQDTGALKAQQLAHVEHERELAATASDEEEVAQHERRADKAEYLREKLEERERSERQASEK
jgi:hypothetical protein